MPLARYFIAILVTFAAGIPANAYCSFPDLIGPVNTPLMVAIWQGDKEAVRRLMPPNLDVKFKTCSDDGKDHFISPLINAIEGDISQRATGDHAGMVEFLLLHGFSPNFSPEPGYTPLDTAASLGNLNMVKTLLRYGATVNPKDGSPAPLISAVQNVHMDVVQELIAAGADFKIRDSIGGNLVLIAASQRDEDMVKFLVQLGVDPCAKDNDGHDAIYWANMDLNENPHTKPIIDFLKAKCAVYD